uniref:hypothetical protein n=1 Tax=Clostridium sp. NkU-1 TaxID=1095009 RepID=UPI000A9989D5
MQKITGDDRIWQKKSCRLWSLVISISILASIPSYGEMPIIQPFPGAGGQTGAVSGPSGSTDGETGPGINNGAGTGSAQTGDTPNAGGTLPADIKQPEIQSEGAVLMDASTGTLLYSKKWGNKILSCQYYKAYDSPSCCRKKVICQRL